jgi:hypothetical protein
MVNSIFETEYCYPKREPEINTNHKVSTGRTSPLWTFPGARSARQFAKMAAIARPCCAASRVIPSPATASNVYLRNTFLPALIVETSMCSIVERHHSTRIEFWRK